MPSVMPSSLRCCWRDALVRGGRRMGDQALGVAEIVGDAHQLERVLERERALLAARHLERDQRRAAAHLLLHDRGLRMVRPARIDQPRHLRMLGQRVGDRGRRSSVCWRTRTASVSRPLSITQALNGDIDGPVCRMKVWMLSLMNFCEPRITPPRQRPWPSMCLVVE